MMVFYCIHIIYYLINYFLEETNSSKSFVQENKTDNKTVLLSNFGLPQLYKSPNNLFHSKIFKYQSTNTGKIHYALLLWPTKNALWTGLINLQRILQSGKFPVIHSVYAGPSIQIVKDNWHSLVLFFYIFFII